MKGFPRARFAVYRLLLAALVCIPAIAALAERVEDLPKPTGYVSDFAHVLSPQAIARLDSLCTQLDHSQANAQIAVVTIHTLDGADPADFATRLFSKMGLGQKGGDRGLLIFLAVDDHKRQIITGYGLEGILPDGKVGDIGREMVPDLHANDFDGAVTLAVGEVAQVIAADAKVTLNDEPMAAGQPAHRGPATSKIIFLVIWLVIFFGSAILRMVFGRRGRSFGSGVVWFGGGGFGGGSGGGGFGGGGGSGGGGFGGFGGGDTGGGGAGGSW
jgi:uncharacterized protein